MENLVANLAGKIRRTTRDGRAYIVATASMIVPGVLKGSRGALFYPEDEIARNVSAWNHIPIVVRHPHASDGSAVSARNPTILDKQGIGEVFNVQANGKLTAEAWIDIDRANKIDPTIVRNLTQGQPIELSTGLFTDNEVAPAGASFNGVPYDAIARNYRPDHLAILMDEKGACSIADGCGVLVNESDKEPTMAKKELIDALIANACCWEETDRETLNTLSEEKLKALKEQGDKQSELELVANTSQEFEDEGGNKHTWNKKTKAWDTALKAPEKEEEEIVANENETKPEETKPLTEKDWLNQAPESVQNTLQYAREIETREKTDIVMRLVANVKNEQEQAKIADRFMTKSLSDLRDMAAILPEEKAKPAMDWSGAAGAPTANKAQDESNFASFGVPSDPSYRAFLEGK